MSEQECRTCGLPGQTVPMKVGDQVIGEATVHETEQRLVTHAYIFPRDSEPLRTLTAEHPGFSFRIPEPEPDPDAPWSRAVPQDFPAMERMKRRYLKMPDPPDPEKT